MAVLNTLIVIALIATIVVLASGVISMAHGEAYDLKHSGQFMSARIGFQALAIVLVVVALLFIV